MCGLRLLHRFKFDYAQLELLLLLASQGQRFHRRLDRLTVVLPKRQNGKEPDYFRKHRYKPCEEIYS
jgi:hypothetical protein